MLILVTKGISFEQMKKLTTKQTLNVRRHASLSNAVSLLLTIPILTGNLIGFTAGI